MTQRDSLIIVKRQFKYAGRVWHRGETLLVSAAAARHLIAIGKAEFKEREWICQTVRVDSSSCYVRLAELSRLCWSAVNIVGAAIMERSPLLKMGAVVISYTIRMILGPKRGRNSIPAATGHLSHGS